MITTYRSQFRSLGNRLHLKVQQCPARQLMWLPFKWKPDLTCRPGCNSWSICGSGISKPWGLAWSLTSIVRRCLKYPSMSIALDFHCDTKLFTISCPTLVIEIRLNPTWAYLESKDFKMSLPLISLNASIKMPLGTASGGLDSGWPQGDVGGSLQTYKVGACFKALAGGVLVAPLDSKYTDVGFNLFSVQVCVFFTSAWI